MNTLASGAAPATSIADRWYDWRDRLLSSRRFRQLAAAWPLTRPIARRRAAELFDIVAGFVYSQVLLACVRVDLFELLAERPQTAAQLATRISLPLDATERLLAAAVALRLAQRRSGARYGLGVLGAPMVGNAALASMVQHHAALYADLRDPVALLRGEAAHGSNLAGFWAYAGQPECAALGAEQVARYSTLMAASQPLVADEVFDAYPLHYHRCLLDVGGGDGTFIARAAQRFPALQLMLFDLPAVAERARLNLARQGLSTRARVAGGDFHHDALPEGADIASLVRVVHDHDDAAALSLLSSVRRALPPGGSLLLAEPLAGTPGAEAMGDAYFGFYLMAMGRGRPRTVGELTLLLSRAGFCKVQQIKTHVPLQTSVLLALTPVA